MHRRVRVTLPALLFCFLSALWPAIAVGQVSFVAPAPLPSATGLPSTTGDVAPPAAPALHVAPAEQRSLVEHGQSLEHQRRWGEALTYYEDALRRYPADPALVERMESARMHYELGRRYSDPSFKRTALGMPERDALDLYAEVLLKIQSHYVDVPDWKQLISHSTKAFEVALADPVFVEHNLSRVPAAQIDHFAREVHDRVASWQITSRHQARDAVAYVARLGRERLGLPTPVSILEYTCGATTGLDTYSTFLTADQLNEVYSQIEGNFVGLGIELKANEGSLLIVKVIPGSPAEKSGIVAGDRIVAVDGQTTADLSTDQAANLLQGKEGTVVQVAVLAAGGAQRVVRVRREQVEVPSIDGGRIIDPDRGIAYLKLTCFQKSTARDLDAELWRLHGLGMKSLIMDLRGNPGGLLAVSVEVVDKFVDNGVIVSTRGRGPQEDYKYTAHPAGTWRVPLVVLIDGESASASEIFAGAIRDHRRGVIVGGRSYGKGSVQGIFPLNLASSGLRLTTAKFYSPLNHPYSGIGVEPDVTVQSVAKPVLEPGGEVALAAAANDAALDAALQQARQQVEQRQAAGSRTAVGSAGQR